MPCNESVTAHSATRIHMLVCLLLSVQSLQSFFSHRNSSQGYARLAEALLTSYNTVAMPLHHICKCLAQPTPPAPCDFLQITNHSVRFVRFYFQRYLQNHGLCVCIWRSDAMKPHHKWRDFAQQTARITQMRHAPRTVAFSSDLRKCLVIFHL